jgi:sucrose-6F-phosphate phosphohydrolase
MGPQRLLVSDLDGTLLGDAPALASFHAWAAAERSAWRIVYATGRTFESVERLIADGSLPAPDAIVANVGTQIHQPGGGSWPGWPTWDPTWDAGVARAALAGRPGIGPQGDANQTPWKASFHAPTLSPDAVDEVRLLVAATGLQATVIYSSERDLDVLPLGAGKAPATRFLAGGWGIADDDVLVAGDSGNDLDLLTAGFRSIVVANAQPELRALEHPLVFHSPLGYAAGVLDGIHHWAGRRLAVPAG